MECGEETVDTLRSFISRHEKTISALGALIVLFSFFDKEIFLSKSHGVLTAITDAQSAYQSDLRLSRIDSHISDATNGDQVTATQRLRLFGQRTAKIKRVQTLLEHLPQQTKEIVEDEKALKASNDRVIYSVLHSTLAEQDKYWQFEGAMADVIADEAWKFSEKQAAEEHEREKRLTLLQNGLFLFGWLLGLSSLLKK
jgi:hypothetical protein